MDLQDSPSRQSHNPENPDSDKNPSVILTVQPSVILTVQPSVILTV